MTLTSRCWWQQCSNAAMQSEELEEQEHDATRCDAMFIETEVELRRGRHRGC
jgi:hypothetical protein